MILSNVNRSLANSVFCLDVVVSVRLVLTQEVALKDKVITIYCGVAATKDVGWNAKRNFIRKKNIQVLFQNSSSKM
jgi:hypothetical protein